MHRIPLLLPLAAIICGIVVRFYDLGGIWSLSGVVALCLIFIFTGRRYVAVLGCAFCLGWLSETMTFHDRPIFLNPKISTECRGLITEINETAIGQALTVEVKAVKTSDGVLKKSKPYNVIVNLNEFETELRPFDIIDFKAKFSPPKAKKDLPDDYDFESRYKLKGIKGIAFLSVSGIRTVGHHDSWRSKLYDIREHVVKIIEDSGVTSECADFLKAILLGDSDSLTKNERNVYSDAGLAHVLALSGTHVAIISSFVLIILMPLRRFGLRTAVYLSAILFMWFYACLTGFTPSVTRSVIMMSILFLARITSRRVNSLNALCFAGIIILAFDPHSLFTPSFQLSFGAVASILLFAGSFRLGESRMRPLKFLIDSVSVTLAAMLGTSLLAAYYFHKFPVYGVVANIPIALLLPLLLATGTLIVIVGLFNLQIPLFAWCADIIYDAVTYVADFFASLPRASIEGIFFDGIVFIPFVAALITLAMFLSKRERFYAYSSSLLFCVTIFFLIPDNSTANTRRIYFTGNNRGTEIVWESEGEAFFATTRENIDLSTVAADLKRRHPDFLNRRSLEGFRPVVWNGKTLTLGNKRFLFINGTADIGEINDSFDYCVVLGKVQTEDLEILTQKADTVVLPRELHLNHVEKLKNALEKSGKPYHSMRENNLWIEAF